MTIRQNLLFNTLGEQRFQMGLSPSPHEEFLSPLYCREGNSTCGSNGAAGTTYPSTGQSLPLYGTTCTKSLLLFPLKFGRPCLSETSQAPALSPCLSLAQTYWTVTHE